MFDKTKTITTIMALCALLSFSVNLDAGTVASLDLKGVIEQNCSISISPLSNSTSLDLKNGHISDQIGTAVETCNAPSGFTISLSSVNGSQLRSADLNNLQSVSYTLKYGGGTHTLSTVPKIVKNVGAALDSPQSVAIKINIEGGQVDRPDTYIDTVFIEIEAK